MNYDNPMIDPADLDHYEQALKAFQRGIFDANRFLHTRLNLGIYTQRQEGMCMVRAKLPGGRLTARQLQGFAICLDRHSAAEHVQITTRQDIQFHYVPLDATPALQWDLAAADIATRAAGGNTVRNITSCQLAGVCPAEYVDVGAYIKQTAEYFIHHPLTQSLPRKFKISFSGCESDCAQGLVQDLGVIATRKEQQPGFRLQVGGGLGAKAKTAIELIEFVPEAELLPAIEAVLALHDRNSDRKRRTRNRIKFLLDRWGADEFRARFIVEFERTRSAFHAAEDPVSGWRDPVIAGEALGVMLNRPLSQRQEGLATLPINVPGGRLKAAQLRGLADLLTSHDLQDVRTSQDQNLILYHVPVEWVTAVQSDLEKLGLQLYRKGERVVACPGTSTCPLGVTNSQRVAFALKGGPSDLSVRINGCQNGCANATVADIGFYGKGRRHFGRLIPSYRIQLGGDGRMGGELAFDGPDIPAVRVNSALERIQEQYEIGKEPTENFFHWSRKKGGKFFEQLLADLSRVSESELPFILRDLGDSKVFQVKSVGVGECAGSQIDPVEKLLLEARYESDLGRAFAVKFKYDEATECLENQLHLVAQAYVRRKGFKVSDERKAHFQYLADTKEVRQSGASSLDSLLNRIAAFREYPDEHGYPLLADEADQWEAAIKQHGDAWADQQTRSGTDG